MSPSNPIVLFDGICNLCNASVLFIIKYEKNAQILFGSLQAVKSQNILKTIDKNIEASDSVLLIENGKVYQNSSAALRIARKLKFFWIFYYLIFLPTWMRDPIYQWIAKNRYQWFGKRNQCMIPDEKLAQRFI